MIRRFGSDLASFKALTFKPGLNILLADKSEGANDRQSRNGAGKTSFVELVHFLFGADVRKESIFRSEVLTEWTFDAPITGMPESAAELTAREIGEQGAEGRLETFAFVTGRERQTEPELAEIGLPLFVR